MQQIYFSLNLVPALGSPHAPQLVDMQENVICFCFMKSSLLRSYDGINSLRVCLQFFFRIYKLNFKV